MTDTVRAAGAKAGADAGTGAAAIDAGVQPPAGVDRPAWLDALHSDGLAHFVRLGLPTRALEDWKYLRIDDLLPAAVVPADASAADAVDAAAIEALIPDLAGPRVVFVNGYLAAGLSRLQPVTTSDGTAAGEPGGVIVDHVAAVAATTDGATGLLAHLVDGTTAPADGFAALNTGLFDDGAVIHVGPGVVASDPVHVVVVTTDSPDGAAPPAGTPVLASPRSVVVAGANSQVTVVETHVGLGVAPNVSNAVTRVIADEGARVRHITLQDVPASAGHLGVVEANVGDGATVDAHTVALGGRVARHELRLHLEGRGAQTSATGLYLPTGDQYHDQPVLVDHVGPDGTSSQLYNGVLDGNGHGVFNGRIVVHPSGAGADATQSNRNLVLSDRAEVDTRPRLEILADEVKCSHGATVGQLDEQSVHYLRSRGIPGSVARGMLTYAFANEMVRRAGHPALVAWIHQRVAERFPGLDPTEVTEDDTPAATPLAAAPGEASPVTGSA